MIDAVRRYDGYVVQSTGDGIFALFGAPVAHEDHPQRALYAALRMQEELRRYSAKLRRRRRQLRSKAASASTPAKWWCARSRPARATEYTPIGHTTNLASRMQTAGAGGLDRGQREHAQAVRGLFPPEAARRDQSQRRQRAGQRLRVTGLGPLRTRFDVARARGLSRFVGRAADIRTLEDALEQRGGQRASGGRGGGGRHGQEPPLLRVPRTLPRARDESVRDARSPTAATFRSADSRGFRDYRDHRCGRPRRAREDRRAMVLLDQSFAEALPLLFDFLGVSEPQHPPPRLDPEARQRQLIGVMRQVIRASARSADGDADRGPALDGWRQRGVRRADGGCVAGTRNLIVNFRPEYRADWSSKSWYRRIPLTPLGREAVGELLADMLGADASIDGLAGPIHARTGGNPFFTEEVVQSLIESGDLEGSAAPTIGQAGRAAGGAGDGAGGPGRAHRPLGPARKAHAASRLGDRQGLSGADCWRWWRSCLRTS